MIGLGLGDEKDITVKGLEIVRRCAHVFLEHYTAILGSVPLSKLEEFYGKKITVADREMVESQAELIIKNAKEEDVAFLVVGDPFASGRQTRRRHARARAACSIASVSMLMSSSSLFSSLSLLSSAPRLTMTC